ncbi:MAG: AF1514 family protein [Thermodesulfobacteriota bacterium]|nr:AF1514 family protein [Thermodesulfobacteriota bacterium]
MAQIHTDPNNPSKQIVNLRISESGLDFQSVKQRAKEKAREYCPDPMLLSWYHRTSGEFYPKLQCDFGDKHAWRVFAESRGANLTVDVNDGEFIFLFLKL